MINTRGVNGQGDIEGIIHSNDLMFQQWSNCSFYAKSMNSGNERKFDKVPWNNQLMDKYPDLPFGFGCESIMVPVRVESIIYGDATNKYQYSPVATSFERENLCTLFTDLDCLQVYQKKNVSNYKAFNYCQYCSNAKNFLQYHFKVIDWEVSLDNSTMIEFPSAFFCGGFKEGIPMFFYNYRYSTLLTPFLCYCSSHDIYSNDCNAFVNYFTKSSFDWSRIVVITLFSLPTVVLSFILVIVPYFVHIIRRRKYRPLELFTFFILLTSTIGEVLVTCLAAIPPFSDNPLLFGVGMTSSAVALFSIYYAMIPAFLVFDRFYMFLITKEQTNCRIFKGLTLGAGVVYALCFLSLITESVYVVISNTFPRLVVFTMIALYIPLLVSSGLFILLTVRLVRALRSVTNVNFFTTRYFKRFVFLNLSLGFPLVLSTINCYVKFKGTSSTEFFITYYTEFFSPIFGFCAFLNTMATVYDKEHVTDCYNCYFVKRITKTLEKTKKKILNEYTPAENEEPFIGKDDQRDTYVPPDNSFHTRDSSMISLSSDIPSFNSTK